MLVISLVANLLMALFMLFKSQNSMTSREEYGQIWDQVDTEADGSLNEDEFTKLLELLGDIHPVSVAEHGYTRKFAQRQKKIEGQLFLFYKGTHKDDDDDDYTQAWTNQSNKASKCSCTSRDDCEKVLPGGFEVNKEDFLRRREQEAPTAATSTAIFYVQTLGLLAKDNENFMTSVSKVLSLDPEENTKTCVSPLGTTERFYVMQLAFTVVTLLLGLILMAPLWNYARKNVYVSKVLKVAVDRTMLKRALLNTYLFCEYSATNPAVYCPSSCSFSDVVPCWPQAICQLRRVQCRCSSAWTRAATAITMSARP